MKEFYRHLLTVAACVIVVLLMLAAPVAGQSDSDSEQRPERELADWERAELQSLVRVVGAALQGELAPTVDPFEMMPSFLKGTDGNTYVPFTLAIDPSKLGESKLATYVYIVPHQDVSSAAGDAPDSEEPELPTAVFEDAYFIDVGVAEGSEGPVFLSRAFSVPGGDYDVYIALRDSKGEDADDDDREAATVMMLKKEVSVPNLWTTELQTSTVLVAETVEPLSAPLSPEEQIANPYTLGTTRIVPKHDRSFGKQDELSLIMLVYNPKLTSDQMPDLTIEYSFHQKTDAGEEFFNKTNPQQFNAQSLPPGFSVALGHQIVAGQSVPLSLFPPGDYRLEILITDNEAGTSVTRDLNFTVRET